MNAPLTTATVAAGMLLGAAILHGQSLGRVPPVDEPRWESCEEMHDTYVARFESAEGFGLGRMLRPAMLDREGVLELGRSRYGLVNVGLVGLLKQPEPVVYRSRLHGMPSANTGTRPLTGFETDSLAGFRSGKDIASAGDEQAGTLQCAGSLRAKASCLRCHKDKKAGDLLGAFTYSLKTLRDK
jgi:hypothetical protein